MNTLSAIPEVTIPRFQFDAMMRFIALMFDLKSIPAYQQWVADRVPASAMLGSPHAPILMGFDFHLGDDGPKLIEINNNAGGLFTGTHGWLAQPAIPGSLHQRLCAMFPDHWRSIAIVDDDIRNQFMLPEMEAYAELLRQQGRQLVLCSPEDICRDDAGFLSVAGQKLDGIYNRHTDFYLEQGSLSHIREALEQQTIDLNPYPRSYALLGDKARMADWWQNGVLESFLPASSCALIRQVVPEVTHLSLMGDEVAWQQRKLWVFKPPNSHAGKGVVFGRKISRSRFDSLDRNNTLMQRFVPASEMYSPDGERFRFDVRVFMCGRQLVALGGRLWQGQLTNFQQPGSGWTAIKLSDDE